jgi:hypothetical protein
MFIVRKGRGGAIEGEGGGRVGSRPPQCPEHGLVHGAARPTATLGYATMDLEAPMGALNTGALHRATSCGFYGVPRARGAISIVGRQRFGGQP